MAEHPDVQLLRDAYDAFGKGELAALTGSWAEDVRRHVPGTTDLAGTYEGHGAVLGFPGAAMDRTEGSLRSSRSPPSPTTRTGWPSSTPPPAAGTGTWTR